MPTHNFPSPEAHAAAVQNANLRLTLLRKSCAPWTMRSLVLPHLRAQWGQAGGGNLVEGTVGLGGAMLFVPTQNVQVIQFDGRRFGTQTFRLQMPGDELCLSSTDWHCWFSVFIPNELAAEWSGAGTAAAARSSRFIQVPSERAEALRHVVAQLGSIVERAPLAFESSVAVDTTARKLTESIREAIWGPPIATNEPGRRPISRQQIVRTTMDFIDRRDGEYLTVADLASAAGVSDRTLRSAFQDYFGIGPARYLKLRTLNQIRKALQNADPSVTTVTGVATQFGVWELGRFARDYQLLFDELPSETLRHVR